MPTLHISDKLMGQLKQRAPLLHANQPFIKEKKLLTASCSSKLNGFLLPFVVNSVFSAGEQRCLRLEDEKPATADEDGAEFRRLRLCGLSN